MGRYPDFVNKCNEMDNSSLLIVFLYIDSVYQGRFIMRSSQIIVQLIGCLVVLTSGMVLGCLCGSALAHASVMPILVTGSLG